MRCGERSQIVFTTLSSYSALQWGYWWRCHTSSCPGCSHRNVERSGGHANRHPRRASDRSRIRDDTQRTAATSRHRARGPRKGWAQIVARRNRLFVRSENSQRRAVSQGTQVMYLIATLEIKQHQCVNELQPANACICHVALREVEYLEGATVPHTAYVR
jgi:uncharacterized protein YqjF (DUF2071 family)